ncbi:amiloride-sensitive sodium channel subunit alpha-like [Haliotis rubra]|uniref:amiloride-sensitive sodium channel subunit alpha-like n=1 Tax=Haliotis rubra TaxID=36100 RepID=UPI001EE6308F|nr:amiloride-sensitive sodium channel subunit alpha-like [Haliotis rubra]
MDVFRTGQPRYREPKPDYHLPNPKVFTSDNDEKEKPRGKCVTFFTYFAESTSFMGIPKIWASPRLVFKIMWTLFFLGATTVMIIQLVELFTTFYKYPVKTSVKLGFTALPFPAVTICNMNPIKLSKAKLLSCELQKTLEIPTEYQSEECVNITNTVDLSEFTETEYVCDESGCYEEEAGGLDTFYVRRELIANYLAAEYPEVRKDVGHHLESMLIECSLNGRSCDASKFTTFLSNDLGNCFTLRSKGLQATKSGPESGLSMVINLESEEFIETFKTGYGLRVVIHDNGTRPFPGSEGFTVSAGSETSIALKLVRNDSTTRGGDYGKCNDSLIFKKKFGVAYTERACREFCQRNLVIDICKCRPEDESQLNSSVKICNTNKEWNCQDRVQNKYVVDSGKGVDTCKCGTPCVEKVYQTTFSSRQWPVLRHIRALEQQACKIEPESPKCSYSSYDFENVDIRTSSFLKLKVYFHSLNFESVKEEPFYDTERFLSDIGGTMGLWIGASVLSLAEFLEILFELIFWCFCPRSK